jgi:hypothetical protein
MDPVVTQIVSQQLTRIFEALDLAQLQMLISFNLAACQQQQL